MFSQQPYSTSLNNYARCKIPSTSALVGAETALAQKLLKGIQVGDESISRQDLQQLGAGQLHILKQRAVEAGNTAILRQLLEENADVSERLVSAACKLANREVIRVFLDFGWSINGPFRSIISPLWMAVDNLGFLRWLVDNGADLAVRSNLDDSLLSVAITSGSLEVVHFLMEGSLDYTRGNLLHCAAQRPNHSEGASLVSALVQHGAEVNAHRYNNAVAFSLRGLSRLPTPLHVACYEQNTLVARALLQHGADPHRQMLQALKEVPPSPLQVAMEDGNADLLEVLMGQP